MNSDGFKLRKWFSLYEPVGIADLRREINLASGSKSTISNEPIPKGAARILNAAQVQKEWAEKKRKAREQELGPAQKKRRTDVTESRDVAQPATTLKIQPGESIAHFNRYEFGDASMNVCNISIRSSQTGGRLHALVGASCNEDILSNYP